MLKTKESNPKTDHYIAIQRVHYKNDMLLIYSLASTTIYLILTNITDK